MHDQDKCEQCGATIPPYVGKQRRFCSKRCRQKWWNSHQDQVQKKAYYSLICRHCGKEFTAYGTQKRAYCSKDCYYNARFGTKEERAERAAAKQRELLERAQLPDHCLACPYYLQATTDREEGADVLPKDTGQALSANSRKAEL